MSQNYKILVCTKGKKCPKRGSKEVADALESAVSEKGLQDSVTVKRCKCMDMCKKGPSVVVMPDKFKYGRVGEEDAKEIVSSMLDGKLVERLRYKKKKKDK